jgi:glycosyltransferase involved in cell wall biosynthesis
VRVAIDCRYIRERPSGIGAYVQALVERLPRLAPDLSWLFLRHPGAREPLSHAPNVDEVIVPYEPGGPVTMWALPRVVDLRTIDLFHATFNLAPAGLRSPVVTTIHDLMWVESPDLCRRPGPWGYVETAFWRHGIERAIRRSDRILTVSSTSARRIAECFPDAAQRTRVTPLAVSEEWRPPRDDERATIRRVREQYVGGAAYVLTVGQAAGYKNHDAVARAFAQAFADDESVHLVFVQRLGISSSLARLVRKLGIASRVHFVSSIPFADLRALVWGALCLCHPSIVEGFGLPVVEALASGCPVVTSNVSALPEVTGGAALLVDPLDDAAIAGALQAIASRDDLRAALSQHGLRRVRRLSWDETARATLAAYREILGSFASTAHAA